MKLLLIISIVFSSAISKNYNFGQKELKFSHSSCLSDNQRAEIRKILNENKLLLQNKGILPKQFNTRIPINFEWPVKAAEHYEQYDYWSISAYVDHNINIGQLQDYNCGNRTYDIPGYNHQGSDIFTVPYPWRMMDNMDVEIVAAASGIILYKSDGNYDTNCGEGGTNWNSVYIQHDDGSEAWYGHMKRFSTTSKEVGESIEVGEYLGIVGSSGNSSGPHLHFEIWDYISPNNYVLIDPFEGICNSTINESAWQNQINYENPGFLALSTHAFTPWYPICPEREIPNEKRTFSPGESIWMLAFFRDLSLGMSFTYKLINPQGNIQFETTFFHDSELWYWAYYWSIFELPNNAEYGEWLYTVQFQNMIHEYPLTVAENGCTDPFSENYNPNALQDNGDCEFCRGKQVSIEIEFDNYPEETWWTLNDSTNTSVNFSSHTNNDSQLSICLQPGDYVFNVFDLNGNGICCNNGNGSIKLIIDDEQVFYADQFGYDDLFAFTINGIELGDINQDSIINIQDIIQLINFILNYSTPSSQEFNLGDLNADSLLNINDIMILIQIIL